MDAHYDSQIKANTHTTFSGPARQMGSGGGIGTFAVRTGRVAIPLVRKYVLLVAKQVGKNLIESAVLEIGQILAGKKKPSRKFLTNVAKRAAIETVKTNLPSGVALRPGGGVGGERKPGHERLHETSNNHQTIESEVIVSQSFQRKRAPREVGPTFCLKFNFPNREKFREWQHQLITSLWATIRKLQSQ